MALAIPTDLTKEEILEFQKLYKKHLGIELTEQEALKIGVNFLQFITLIIEDNNTFTD